MARQVAMYVAKQQTGLTLVEIGRRFGNRDHSTVIYALNRVSEEMKRSEAMRQTLARIEAELENKTSAVPTGPSVVDGSSESSGSAA